MAKVTFTSLGLKQNNEVKTFDWNGKIVEVKQYLPVEQKMMMITNILNASTDDNVFYNYLRIVLFTRLEYILYYTNITFTDKQSEDFIKQYDIMESTGFINKVLELIPEDERKIIATTTFETIKVIYDYKNSVSGIIDEMKSGLNNIDTDIDKFKEKMTSNPEAFKMLKDIMNNFD